MTTKKCQKCGCKNLIEIRSQFKKLCPKCGIAIPWKLHDGQEMIK